MLEPNLRVIIDGDSTRAYHEGDHVQGRVVLVLDHAENVEGLRLDFVGACVTKTTRPFYVSGNDAEACNSRREYEEKITMFNFEQSLLAECSLVAKKYSWNFDFTFPSQTERQFSRWKHGSKYLREPHPLPPTFQTFTNSPGGKATISYYVQANLSLGGSKGTVKATEMLRYLPSRRITPREPLLTSRTLYGQTWKPDSGNSGMTVDKLITKFSRKQSDSTSAPRIVPTLYFPERITPGQHIPLLLCLARANIGEHPPCVLSSLKVALSTYTTSTCGQPLTQPEDVVAKHVTCITKDDLDQTLSFSTPTPLTTNFRLVDDAECVPTFRTYTITRRYTLSITLGIKSQGHRFTIQSTMPLEIVPRHSLSETTGPVVDEDGEVDPLPLYMPREPSKEFAPDYETLYSLSPTPSTSASLALTDTRRSSIALASTPSTAPTTPGLEIGQPILERSVWRDRQTN